MAKELPYFKFEPNQWENGNIQICTKEEKGVFTDLCSMYWSRLGDLSYKLAVQKICGGNATALDSLYENKIIDIIEGNIYIKFLSEQLNEFELESERNSKNAKEGWEKRRKQKELSDPNATALQTQSDLNARREEEIKEDESIVYRKFKHLSITISDYNKLISKWNKEQVEIILNRIENYKKNTKYVSLYLTALEWLKKDFPILEVNPHPYSPTQLKDLQHRVESGFTPPDWFDKKYQFVWDKMVKETWG